MAKQARLHELEQTVTLLQRKWGQRAIRPMRQLTATRPPVLSTGLAPLDQALGIGGLPRGRVTELVTAGSSGQALLLASLIRQTQRGGEAVVYVDVDQSLDLDLLARRDIDLRRLYILRPHGFRHALEMTGDLLAEGGAALIVFDRLQPLLFEDASLALLDQALRCVATIRSAGHPDGRQRALKCAQKDIMASFVSARRTGAEASMPACGPTYV